MEYVAAGAGALALLLAILLLFARRARKRARAAAADLESRLSDSSDALGTARAGEREAVWALSEARTREQTASTARDEAFERIAALEADLDDLSDRLAAADRDLASARRDADDATTELVWSEGVVAAGQATGEDPAELRARVDELSRALEAEQATVALLRLDVAADGTGGGSDGDYRARLVASEARRRDLEDRLESLSAVRAAEQRTAAERIAGLERLHLRLGESEDRVETLEADLKTAEEARDDALEEASRLEVELVRLKGELTDAQRRLGALESEASALAEARQTIDDLQARLDDASSTTAEVDRLRKSLEAERARAERIARRATESASTTTYAMWDRVVRERVDAAVSRETSRLQQQVAHLRAVVEEKEERLRAISSEPISDGRELPPITAIRGIGTRIAEILAHHGVTSIAHLAEIDDERLDELAAEMPVYPGRVREDDWRGQARALLEAAKHPRPAESEPIPVGPPPITAISGIGPKIAAILAGAGITTIADVAALTDADVDRLAALMPVYPGRIRDDDWVGQARSLL